MRELPAGWEKAALAELAEFSPKHDPARLGDMISFVPMPAVSAEFGTIEDAVDRPLSDVWKGFTHFADGDVIFAKITPCMENGKIAVARGLTNGLGCGSTEFHVLRSYGAVLPDFLWRFMRQGTFRKDAEASMTGAVGQRRVPTDHLKAAELPIPPLAEQRRIVAKLDALTARTARARADLDRIPGFVARYKLAVLAKAFAGELFADGGGSWKPFTLGELGKWGSGGTPKSGRAEYYGGAIPWVRSGDLSDGPVASHVVTITDAGLANSSAKWVPTGSVLLAMYGATIGKVGLTTYPVTTNQAVASLQCEQSLVSPSFAFWLLRSLKPAFVGAGQGGAQPNISQTIIKPWPVLVPSLDEQEKVVRALERVFTEIDRLTAEAAAARRLLDRLDQTVLTKAFRGELVPQDPADEPASVLLDRIRAERAAAPKVTRGRRKAAA